MQEVEATGGVDTVIEREKLSCQCGSPEQKAADAAPEEEYKGSYNNNNYNIKNIQWIYP
jgi:hypothetical protein